MTTQNYPQTKQSEEFFQAVRDNDLVALKDILDRNFDPNTRDSNGFAALHIAGFWNCIGAAELLLKAGADVNAVFALDGSTPLMFAAREGNAAMAALFLEHKAKINQTNLFGRTALMFAATNGSDKTTALFLAKGADISLRNHKGETALSLARRWHYPKVVALLEAECAKLTASLTSLMAKERERAER